MAGFVGEIFLPDDPLEQGAHQLGEILLPDDYLEQGDHHPGEILLPSAFLEQGSHHPGEIFIPVGWFFQGFHEPVCPPCFIYRMRGYDGTLARIVYWDSDIVDSGGTDYTGPGPLSLVVLSNDLSA